MIQVKNGTVTSARINGRPATTALLRQIASLLIDIHGQRDSQELLSTEKHMAFVDGFGELGKELAAYREVYKKLQEAREKLESLQMDESYKLQRQDILQYQIGEIEGAKLTPGEEEELLAQREIIRNAEKITSALGTSYQLLTGGEEGLGLVSGLEGLGEELETASRFIEELGDYREKTEDLRYELEELSSTLRGYLDDYNFDPRQLDEVESRLDLIHRLKKKYGATIQEILDYWERSAQELDELTFADERAEKLRGEVADLTGKAKELAAVLSKKRGAVHPKRPAGAGLPGYAGGAPHPAADGAGAGPQRPGRGGVFHLRQPRRGAEAPFQNRQRRRAEPGNAFH